MLKKFFYVYIIIILFALLLWWYQDSLFSVLNEENLNEEEWFNWFLNELLDIIMIIGLYASSIYVKVIYLLDIMEYIYLVIKADPNGNFFLNCYIVIFWCFYICYLIYEIKLLIEKIKLWYKIFIKKKV